MTTCNQPEACVCSYVMQRRFGRCAVRPKTQETPMTTRDPLIAEAAERIANATYHTAERGAYRLGR